MFKWIFRKKAREPASCFNCIHLEVARSRGGVRPDKTVEPDRIIARRCGYGFGGEPFYLVDDFNPCAKHKYRPKGVPPRKFLPLPPIPPQSGSGVERKV